MILLLFNIFYLFSYLKQKSSNIMIPLHITLNHYKRKDIQEEIIYNSKNKEVAAKFDEKFGNRPDVLNYPKDILELAKQGATSFHASEELWQNPLVLNPNLKKFELDNLKSISCKFSGNKGFHIGVPFEAFPEEISSKKTKEMFPEAARRVAFYIKELIKKPLGEKIMRFEDNDFSKIMQKTNKAENEIKYFEKNEFGDKIGLLNAEPFLNIDTILISSRHLYRMPYSLHEKSGLVSLPINPSKVLEFEKEDAKPENVKVSKFRFLDRENAVKAETKHLIMQAFDFTLNKEEEIKVAGKREYEIPQAALKEELFPPCIKLILNGLEDGRKRAVFILCNFLTSVGWDYSAMENLLKEWR